MTSKEDKKLKIKKNMEESEHAMKSMNIFKSTFEVGMGVE